MYLDVLRNQWKKCLETNVKQSIKMPEKGSITKFKVSEYHKKFFLCNLTLR